MRFVRHGFAGFFLITLAALAFLPQRGPAQQQTPPDYSQSFDKTDAMIPARDGVKLHAEIYAPKNAAEPLPIILERTPYGTVNDAKGYSRKLGRYLEMIPDGYIFVFQDIRDRKSTRLNSSHSQISYAVFCLKKKKKQIDIMRHCIDNKN